MSGHSDLHAAYIEAAPNRRWQGGSLKSLWTFLEDAAKKMSPDWVGVVLPGGAHVALRQRDGEPRELLIYRKEPFTTEDGEAKWSAEVMTFLRHFSALDWNKEHERSKSGGPICRCTERARIQDFFDEKEHDE